VIPLLLSVGALALGAKPPERLARQAVGGFASQGREADVSHDVLL